MSASPYSTPCLSGCLFVILHMPFCKAKSGHEQLSDVCPSLLLVMSCWITEIAVTRKVGLEETFSCIPKPLSYRGGQQVSHSMTWASLKSSSPDVCPVLSFLVDLLLNFMTLYFYKEKKTLMNGFGILQKRYAYREKHYWVIYILHLPVICMCGDWFPNQNLDRVVKELWAILLVYLLIKKKFFFGCM